MNTTNTKHLRGDRRQQGIEAAIRFNRIASCALNPKFAISAATADATRGFEGALPNNDSRVLLVEKFS